MRDLLKSFLVIRLPMRLTRSFFNWKLLDNVQNFTRASIVGRESHQKTKVSRIVRIWVLLRRMACNIKTVAYCSAKTLTFSLSGVTHELLVIRNGEDGCSCWILVVFHIDHSFFERFKIYLQLSAIRRPVRSFWVLRRSLIAVTVL